MNCIGCERDSSGLGHEIPHTAGVSRVDVCPILAVPSISWTFSRWYRLGEPFPIWKAEFAAHLENPAENTGLLPFGSTGYGAIVDEARLEAKMANVIAPLKKPDMTRSP